MNINELKERARREKEAKRLQEQNRSSFANDGFFESTQYYNTPDTGRSDSSSGSSDSSSIGSDS